ncbi:glycogen debranching enzyme [Candidatus Nitrososphaera evergladensis SR1]|uniref:Glycogen debranching enzyme n=1 Tax=Candidatus Nitrososphaera evergladensis SR1 TaxID=1459636 RepID=A0A075MSE1_9ARCH|nr:amylo-alpha-1,6-glucosidase [Candidatus Nitrososphaera evergladensis]AIF84035.1 glycogen debranching enzyme [Candidatus Nitrososphaera evergladensis SR1]
MTRALDSIHTSLSYVKGSLKNATVVVGGEEHKAFSFSLLNPPVPLGGNVVSLDVFVDDIPVQKKMVYIATQESIVNASSLSDSRPIAFKPFQSARFLVINDSWLGRGKHRITLVSKLEGFELIAIPFTFSDTAGRQNERIVLPSDLSVDLVAVSDSVFRNFSTPLALSGKRAYILCSSNGSLSAPWEWMGVKYDNGGLYVPPARVFGRIIVEISMDDGVRKRLPNFVVWSRHENGVLTTRHELGGIEVQRKLFVPPESRGFVIAMEMRMSTGGLSNGSRKKRKLRIHFIIDGNITSYGLAAVSQSNVARFDTKNQCLHIRTAHQKAAQYFGTIGVAPKMLSPCNILVNSFDNDTELSYDVEVGNKEPVQVALVGAGSFTSARGSLAEFLHMRNHYQELLQETEQSFRDHASSTVVLRQSGSTPGNDMARLLSAYEKAKASLQYLKGEYDGLGEGICAGLPRFPNYWARDTGWSLRGYLAIGDYSFARTTIDNFLSHQARNVPGVTRGELPMIISGKAFLHSTTYGSADSTFLFPWAIREYALATGDIAYLKKRWKQIVDLVDWGLHKDLDNDGFVEHGFSGIAMKLPIQDSTWMDHIDRRKSANDVQALFYESLVVGSDLARLAGDAESEKRWAHRADELKRKINEEYWRPDAGFYFDTIRKDLTKDASIRPNALVLVLAGVAEEERARLVVERLEKDDITTPWGVRTLSNLDLKYQPALYHDGAVWPLVTGWMALAELRLGRREAAYRYVRMMADRILEENGMFAETYRGDRPEPFNSCILQAWSAGMYVKAFLDMALGMKIDMVNDTVSINPQIPESLKAGCGKMEFSGPLFVKGRQSKFSMTLDVENEKLSVDFGNLPKKPQVQSSRYAL